MLVVPPVSTSLSMTLLCMSCTSRTAPSHGQIGRIPPSLPGLIVRFLTMLGMTCSLTPLSPPSLASLLIMFPSWSRPRPKPRTPRGFSLKRAGSRTPPSSLPLCHPGLLRCVLRVQVGSSRLGRKHSGLLPRFGKNSTGSFPLLIMIVVSLLTCLTSWKKTVLFPQMRALSAATPAWLSPRPFAGSVRIGGSVANIALCVRGTRTPSSSTPLLRTVDDATAPRPWMSKGCRC